MMPPAKILKKASQIPIDQYSRQFVAWSVISELKGNPKKRISILDVGGYKGITKDFFPDDNVSVLDVFKIKEKNYIYGDGSKTGLKDSSYDFTVSFDTLEHVPKPKRKKFIEEQIRVAKTAAIIACPVETELNSRAEVMLNEYYKDITGFDHRWLKEHIENGLPSEDFIEQTIENKGFNFIKISLNPTSLWFMLQHMILESSVSPASSLIIDKVYEIYNQNLLNIDINTSADSYRRVYVIYKNRNIHKKLFENTKFSDDLNAQIQDLMFRHMYEMKQAVQSVNLNRERRWHEKLIQDLSNKSPMTPPDYEQIKLELAEIKGSKAWKLLKIYRKAFDKIRGFK